MICLCLHSFAGLGNTPILPYNNISVSSEKPDSIPDSKKRLLVTGANIALWTGSFIALNEAWYKDYERSSFHFFNDNKEWKQMDKAGHIWSTYQISRWGTELWKWAGVNSKKSAILGGVSGIAYQSIIEIQDAFSKDWGFSWGDMAANLGGAAIFISQEIGWREQRIQIKMSYWPYSYSPELIERRNQIFGVGMMEKILKDYNSQTYWISGNLKLFFPKSNFPAWLNIAAGYRADGMLGARSNTWTDKSGIIHNRSDIKRMRRFYISPDIDFTKIKTRSRMLSSLFFLMNSIKIPAPALEFGKGGMRVHGVYF